MTILASSVEIKVNDTSTPKITCSVTPNLLNVNEGQQVIYTVVTSNVPDYTTLYWMTKGRVAAGFDDNTTSGTVVIESGHGTIVRSIKANEAVDGVTTMDMIITSDLAHNTILATTELPTSIPIDYLVVAGGGAGGWNNGGGGGAGGAIVGSTTVTPDKNYPIFVGSGGAGISYFGTSNGGSNSSAFGIIAVGGGGGGVNSNGANGGSGGGAAMVDTSIRVWVDASRRTSYPTATSNGEIWYDLTVNNNNYKIYNGVTYNAAIASGSLLFEGEKKQCAIHSTSLYNSSTINLYSMELWVQPITAGQLVSIISSEYFNAYHYCAIEIDANGLIRFNQWLNSSEGLKNVASSSRSLTAWYHLALTYDGTKAIAYINGVQVGVPLVAVWGSPGVYNLPTLFSLLTQDTTNLSKVTAYPTARIGSFIAYNRVLTATEIKNNYNAQYSRYPGLSKV